MVRVGRLVEACPHRFLLSSGAAGGPAGCGLLTTITGVEDRAFASVPRAACEECCRSFPPTVDECNPVVASLLYDLSARIVDEGGLAGCDVNKARALNRRAILDVPTEEDCLEPPPGSVSGGEVSAPALLDEIIPPPSRRTGPRVRHWAVGVTTAARPVPTLSECLTSLANAGWARPRLFADGPVVIPEGFGDLPRTNREPLMGAWPHYFLSLSELLMRESEADAYMLVRDDVVFAADLDVRAYLERVLWPGSRPGIVSLFGSRAYTQSRAGWYRFEGVWHWGALAFVFSREAAQHFLADIGVVRHRWSRGTSGRADIDRCIGGWAARRDIPVYHPTPSLVRPIGDKSPIATRERACPKDGRRGLPSHRGPGESRVTAPNLSREDPVNTSTESPSYRSFNDLCRCINKGIQKLPDDVDLVVGIPRSGLLVANLIALRLNKPLTDLESFVDGRVYRAGRRLEHCNRKDIARRARKILVVDDSVNTGHEMQRAKELIQNSHYQHDVVFMAAYARTGSASLVDISFEICECPRLFEWNLMNNFYLKYAMLDIDGVLCVDPSEEENDDGPRYMKFVEEASSLFLPTVPVGALVTCRLEKYRFATERWLSDRGVQYRDLLMWDLPSKAARQWSQGHGKYKGKIFREHPWAKLFIESSFEQAVVIAEESRKPVLCIETQELITPSANSRVSGAARKNSGVIRGRVMEARREIYNLFNNIIK